jgi:hypothetical protein
MIELDHQILHTPMMPYEIARLQHTARIAHTRLIAHMYVSTHVYMYIHIHTCIHVYTHTGSIYGYMYIHILVAYMYMNDSTHTNDVVADHR